MNSIGYFSSKTNHKNLLRSSLYSIVVLALLLSLFGSAVDTSPVLAATTLTLTPITWNVIGLDSNNPAVGPDHFPVGVRVCNTGSAAAGTVTATFKWDNNNNSTYIYLRPGTTDVLTVPSLAVNACTDFYYEVEVKRDVAAYTLRRPYHIEVTDFLTSGQTWSTPVGRELYVEYLISQSRNSTDFIDLSTDNVNWSRIPPGGTMTLMKDQYYYIKLTGFTATNGYEQIETFINLPNTIFQVISVNTTYTAESSSHMVSPWDRLYGDACLWENDPLSLNYRSCLDAGVNIGKAGGDITVTYYVKIISVPQAPLTNPEPFFSLIYDFSGSSYHYNAGYSESMRFFNIVDAGIAKSFSPKSINANTIPSGTSTLTFTITNPGPSEISSVNFTDNLPAGVNPTGGQMTIASTAVTYTNCGGSPAPSSLTVGQTSLAFTDITVAGLGACTISVTVTANADGTYNNTTGHLFIGTQDTGNVAQDTLIATSKPPGPTSCATPVTIATWTMPTSGQGSGGPPPPYTTKASDVFSANALAGLTGLGVSSIVAGDTGQTNAWQIRDAFSASSPAPFGAPYFQFSLDTSNYGGAAISFNYDMILVGEWSSGGSANNLYVYSSIDGTNFTLAGTITATKGSWQPAVGATAVTTGVSTTYFRILADTRNKEKTSAALILDNINITGCPRPDYPTLSKSFSPASIPLGSASTLTFTLTNPNTSALTGVGFSDTLPLGLVINTPNGLTTPSCSSGSMTGTPTASAGTRTISLSGATLSAGATCTFSVSVKGNVAEEYHNVSGSITSAQTGLNTTSTGYGVSDLEVVAPPVVEKVFGVTSIINGTSTTLTFGLFNPNRVASLTGVNFVGGDILPTDLVVSTAPNLTGPTCRIGTMTGTITANAGSGTISLTGGTLSAGAVCVFSVDVTGTSTGLKTNSVTVGSTNGGTGNTATATILVRDETPKISFMKQVGISATGPWYNSTTITAGTTAYYRFVVENIGDVQFSNFQVNDPLLGSPISCSPWKRVTDNVELSGTELPVAAGLPTPADPAAYCIYAVTPATAGDITNTATAQGYTTSWLDSNTDTANYKNYNYGHLPSAYPNMNLISQGGAMQLNGNTYFGTTVTSNASDGINTVDYTPKATDDGVTYTPEVTWSVASGGSVDVSVVCNPLPPATSCYLNAWMDWNRDNDFTDTGDQIFTNYAIPSGSGTYTLHFNIPTGTVFDETLPPFYSRFRISNQSVTSPLPNGLALNGTTQLVGEIEDPFFNSSGGGVITPITVSYFKAEGQGNQVRFDWYTATETGNLGFNLYAAQGRRLTRLNDELIPSSVIDSLSQQQYSYTAQTAGKVFYIEDVNLLGETRRHGPFALGEEYGSTAEAKLIDWAAIQSELDSADALQLEQSSVAGQVTALNMKVNQTGMIRLTFERLRYAGLNLNGVRPATISVTNGGRAVPIRVTSTNGWFGAGSYIEFYGRALDTLYTDTNVYTIRSSQTRSPLIATNNALIPTGVTPAAYYLETVSVNNQNEYAEYTPGTDPWYDSPVFVRKTASSKVFLFEVNGLADVNSPATLNLVVWGMSELPLNPDHHIQVSINGTPVADQTFDGVVEQDVNVSIPGGVLHAGTNTLTLTLPADTGGVYDLVYLDKFSVTYQRQFIAQDGKLTFKAAGKVFRVKNLPSRNVVVYRLVNNRPVRIGHVTVVKASDATYTATFPGATASYTYLVSAVESLYKPVFSMVPAIPNLNIPARYLIIAHPAFIQGIQPLVQARKAQGYTVNVVNVNDLYAKYTYGVFDPKAIKNYIAYAAGNLGTQYVLLVGGDTFDYRNHYGYDSISFIPSLYAQTAPQVKFVPVDPLYADVNGDKVPDLAIGRFPVRTQADLELMVNKTLAYQNKNYGRTALFVSDEADGETNFKEISLKMSETLPRGWSVQNIHLDDLDFDTAQTQLLAGMNSGTALVNFTGHSDPWDWTFAGLFSTWEAEALTNTGRPFVAVQWGCWNNYYVDPSGEGLVQSFLISGDRGAAATLGAATLTDSYSEELLGKLLIPRLAMHRMTIGQALKEAKLELARTNPDLLDVLLGWNLMGDPALVIVP